MRSASAAIATAGRSTSTGMHRDRDWPGYGDGLTEITLPAWATREDTGY